MKPILELEKVVVRFGGLAAGASATGSGAGAGAGSATGAAAGASAGLPNDAAPWLYGQVRRAVFLPSLVRS